MQKICFFEWIILAACAANLQAQGLVWGPSHEYDLGFNPSVAADNFTGTVIEVHNGRGGDGRMWYHVGQVDPSTQAVRWGPPYEYDVGFNPKVAISGASVVEVHNGGGVDGPMWYHLGQVDASTLSVQWGLPYEYDVGFNPSVAVDGTTVVEVHNGSSEGGPMWYHVGQIDTSTQTVQWGLPYEYDIGFNPSVAFAGGTVVEVHNGTSGHGPMWYHVGYLNAPVSQTIQWGLAHDYDTGFNPSVSWDINTGAVLEVHNGTGRDGGIWCRAGEADARTQTIQWQSPHEYDIGFNPSVAVISFGPTPPGGHFPFTVPMVAIEVHNGTHKYGPMWSHLSTSFQ
jgi:hypothetical protein